MIIVIFAFGVTSQALMFPNQDLSSSLLGQIFLPAYFVIAGGYSLDNVYAAINNNLIGNNSMKSLVKTLSIENIYKGATCDSLNLNTSISFSNYKYNALSDCPNQTGAIVTLILVIFYIIILVVMLLNLLIAIFKYKCN